MNIVNGPVIKLYLTTSPTNHIASFLCFESSIQHLEGEYQLYILISANHIGSFIIFEGACNIFNKNYNKVKQV